MGLSDCLVYSTFSLIGCRCSEKFLSYEVITGTRTLCLLLWRLYINRQKRRKRQAVSRLCTVPLGCEIISLFNFLIVRVAPCAQTGNVWLLCWSEGHISRWVSGALLSIIRGVQLTDLEQSLCRSNQTHALCCLAHPFPIAFCDRRSNATHKGSSGTFRKYEGPSLKNVSLITIKLFHNVECCFTLHLIPLHEEIWESWLCLSSYFVWNRLLWPDFERKWRVQCVPPFTPMQTWWPLCLMGVAGFPFAGLWNESFSLLYWLKIHCHLFLGERFLLLTGKTHGTVGKIQPWNW